MKRNRKKHAARFLSVFPAVERRKTKSKFNLSPNLLLKLSVHRGSDHQGHREYKSFKRKKSTFLYN